MDAAIARLREEYTKQSLDEAEAATDPFEQFGRWFGQTLQACIPLANGMTLATVDADGQPSTRVVLLKSFDARGFVFFTNYASRKARELEANPKVSVCFWWVPLERQVRIAGVVQRVTAQESDDYFKTRPRDSNLGAIASLQSEVVPNRATLDAAVEQVRVEWEGKQLERPDRWGGYRLVPHAVEFWQGRRDRLHDRLRYRRDADRWVLERLSP